MVKCMRINGQNDFKVKLISSVFFFQWDFEEANGKWRELSTTTRGEFVPHQAASNPGDM